jgi:hypothetical protein
MSLHKWERGQKIVLAAQRITVLTASTVGEDLNKSNPKWLSL